MTALLWRIECDRSYFNLIKSKDYGGVRYLTNNEVGKILDGLLFLTEDGFKERSHRESQKVEPCPYIDWSEEEMLDWLTDYYREIVKKIVAIAN